MVLWKLEVRRELRLVEFRERGEMFENEDKGIGECDVVNHKLHLEDYDKRAIESNVYSGDVLDQRVRTSTPAWSQQSLRCVPSYSSKRQPSW